LERLMSRFGNWEPPTSVRRGITWSESGSNDCSNKFLKMI
jgi:hypothetical protein